MKSSERRPPEREIRETDKNWGRASFMGLSPVQSQGLGFKDTPAWLHDLLLPS